MIPNIIYAQRFTSGLNHDSKCMNKKLTVAVGVDFIIGS